MAKQTAVPTRHVRIAEDLADMLGEVIEAQDGLSMAEFLDPLIRTAIEARHRANLPAIKVLRAARERAKKLRDEAPAMANEIGGEG
jgi:hypothetical protein